MPTRTLVQALEGIRFPCDRSRLIEYARARNASGKALSTLELIPDRRFANMTEVFTALPSKHDAMLQRASARSAEAARPEGRQAERGERVPPESPPAPLTPPSFAPSWTPTATPLDFAVQWWGLAWRLGSEWSKMSLALWQPWLR